MKTVKAEGPAALFKGFGPAILRASLSPCARS